MKKYKILLVDDEINITSVLKAYFLKENYIVFTANNGKEALELFENEELDLIILDLMMPYISGEDVCKKIRKTSRIPIIMLTAKSSEDSLVNGIDIGADDYIIKPFKSREVVAKAKAVLRRSNSDKLSSVPEKIGPFLFDYEKRIVKKNDKIIALTPNETSILFTLVKNPGRTFSRDQLISFALDDNFEGFDRSIDTYIKTLRKKVEDDRKSPKYIKTTHGIGYRFEK